MIQTNITKETLWMSYMGDIKPLKDCEDTHLANIIHHVIKHDYFEKEEIKKVCLSILEDRGISFDFTTFAQIPHKNNEGLWACWDDEKNRPRVLQK